MAYARTTAGSPTTTLSFRFVGNSAEQQVHARRYGFDTTFEGEPRDDFHPHDLEFYQGRYCYPHKMGHSGPNYHSYLLGQLTDGRFRDE
ncbi:hypothetical protein ACFQ48_19425 [Hymenobacter caeli]|uniref:Uncharacterized protein n=1 Tax=Hymenobacter caeli TaxID=2735894 RepID=A0ABX2FVT8_9BACT|nr:hypothetical protein [Hymenobacter caeli]NRT21131.1 hypothetical protein [Hymenobacter caeli]